MLIIVVVSIVLALHSTEQIKKKTVFIRQCILMIENISIYLEYNSLSIKDIFYVLSNSNNYDLLVFLTPIYNKVSVSTDFNIAYQSLISNLKLGYIDSEDKSLLLGFFSLLGKSDIKGQLSNCNLYKTFFSKKLKVLEETQNEKCKVCFALYIGIGLCLSILIL